LACAFLLHSPAHGRNRKDDTMFRTLLGAALLSATAATAALATVDTVAEVKVEADLTAISNERAAAYWATLTDDLQGAILARLTDKLAEEGATVSVDIREIELANAFERAFDISDAVLVGQVNISDLNDSTAYDSYELSVSLEGGQVVDAAGNTIVVTGIDTPEAYRTLVDRFADGVVERLN